MTALHRVPHLLAPRATPDGTVLWEENSPEVGRRLREGDANVGWLGDDRLSLHLNLAYAHEADPADPRAGHGIPRWEVWRDHETVAPTLVCSIVNLRIGNGDQLLRMLAAHDSRTHDMATELITARDARTAREKATFQEMSMDKGDRLAHGLGRDLGMAGQHGRVYPLG